MSLWRHSRQPNGIQPTGGEREPAVSPNPTAATIPLAAQDALEKGLLKPGKLALIAAVGAGYTVGASLWRWAY